MSETAPTDPTRAARAIPLRNAVAIAITALLIGAAIAAGLTRRSGPAPAPSPTVAAIGAVPQPRAPATRAAAPTPDAASLDAREQLLAAQLAGLEARTSAVAVQADAAGGNAARAEGLLIAFAARRAIDRGLGLGYLEQQLRARFGASQPGAVDTIIQTARDPVTVEDLRLSLDTIGPQLAFGPGDDGWLGAFWRRLGGMVVIRRQGAPSPDAGERLDRIRRFLDQRQVEAAAAEAARLPGAARAPRWMAAARRFVDAHRALDTIEATALTGGVAGPEMLPSSSAPAAN
ncbi:hypothetical protein [uncultured Sphingomonas sp.]|uniref:hypothetical protein n=1 Tax=uncultured Sphingomonas sp. TaxID=158754 RepID=UPI0035CC7358